MTEPPLMVLMLPRLSMYVRSALFFVTLSAILRERFSIVVATMSDTFGKATMASFKRVGELLPVPFEVHRVRDRWHGPRPLGQRLTLPRGGTPCRVSATPRVGGGFDTRVA